MITNGSTCIVSAVVLNAVRNIHTNGTSMIMETITRIKYIKPLQNLLFITIPLLLVMNPLLLAIQLNTREYQDDYEKDNNNRCSVALFALFK